MAPTARPTFGLLLLLSTVGLLGPAVAENSTQAPPPSANKIGGGGGSDGDPTGAVRALGSADDTNAGGKQTVTVPRLGSGGPSRPSGAPSGSGPSR